MLVKVLSERRTGESSWWDKGTWEACMGLVCKLGQEVARKKDGCQSVAQIVLDATVQTPGGCFLHRQYKYPFPSVGMWATSRCSTTF